MPANIPAITVDLDALITDGNVHTRTECMTIVSAHGGFNRHFVVWRQGAKDRGIHVADEWSTTRREWTYWEADSPAKTNDAVEQSLRRRTIPEQQRRLRATRGEREVARLHSRSVNGWDREIAAQEAMLSSLAVKANLTPSTVLGATFLDPATLTAIAADVTAGRR